MKVSSFYTQPCKIAWVSCYWLRMIPCYTTISLSYGIFSGEVYAKMNLFYLKFFFYCLLISNTAFFCVLLLKVQVSRRRLNFIQTFNTQNAIFIWVFKYFFSFGKLYPSSLWMSSNANAKMLGILLPTNVLLIL